MSAKKTVWRFEKADFSSHNVDTTGLYSQVNIESNEQLKKEEFQHVQVKCTGTCRRGIKLYFNVRPINEHGQSRNGKYKNQSEEDMLDFIDLEALEFLKKLQWTE